eukprot:COSAG05_NODE_38_length_27626_cov_78.614306_26_plen_570_part_00
MGAMQPPVRLTASTCKKTFTLLVFFAINLLNYMDRYAVAGALPLLLDCKTSGLHKMSNTQGALLTTAFIVVYMCASPVFGYLADRSGSRKCLVMLGLLLWAVASAASSFAPNYTFLLLARGAIGIGEASYNTITPVIISDMYPPAERTAKLALFYIAIPLGSGIGYVIGGKIGGAFGWRWALRVTPALLVLLTTLAVPFVHEPARGESDGADGGKVDGEGESGITGWLRDAAAVMRTPSFAFSTAGAAMSNFAVGALAQWVPTFITAVEGGVEATQHDVFSPAYAFGVVTCIAGITGTILGSTLANYLTKVLSNWGAEALVCAFSMGLAAPLLLGSLISATHSLYLFWALVLIGEIALCLFWAPLSAFAMLVITPRRRATAQGINLLASHVLGCVADLLSLLWHWLCVRASVALYFALLHASVLTCLAVGTSDAFSPLLIGILVDMQLAGHHCSSTPIGGGEGLGSGSGALAAAAAAAAADFGAAFNGSSSGDNYCGSTPYCTIGNATSTGDAGSACGGESEGGGATCVDSVHAQMQAYQIGAQTDSGLPRGWSKRVLADTRVFALRCC